MLTNTEKRFSILFFIIVLIEIIIGSIEAFQALHYIAKPAIVASLMVFFLTTSKHLTKQFRQLTITALGFCLLGDILLMFIETSPHFFTFGLIAFLLAHLFYVMVFLKHSNNSIRPIGFSIVSFVYAFGLFYILKDGLGAMRIPVIMYMVVILTMVGTAYIRKGKVNSHSFLLVFIGALLFMLSDSILAINKFYAPLPCSNISIMLTYGLAQYLIVLGILRTSVTNPSV